VIILLVAAVGMVGLFLLLGVYGGKGGPTETAQPGIAQAGEAPWLSRLTLDGLEKLLHRLFAAMRFEVEQSQVVGNRLEMIVRDPTPISGGRLHVRGVLQTDSGMVTQDEVQAALDAARGDPSAAKAVVVSPLGFSSEARLAVQSTSCQLVDQAGLLDLLQKFLPEALESQGAGYV
jgi:hypothetical protein